MDIIWFCLVLITLLNSAICILLPRLLTYNWLEATSGYLGERKEQKQIQKQVAAENIVQS